MSDVQKMVFWTAPDIAQGTSLPDADVDQIKIYSYDPTGTFPPAVPAPLPDPIKVISATDVYHNNYITGYLDPSNAGDFSDPLAPLPYYYAIAYYKAGVMIGDYVTGIVGKDPLQVTPWDIIKRIPSLSLSGISYEDMQKIIERQVSKVEQTIRQPLSVKTFVKELYPGKEVYKVIAFRPRIVRLRHYPVVSVDNIYVRQAYRLVRAGEAYDYEITSYLSSNLQEDASTGYNRGNVEIWVQQQALPVLYSNIPMIAGYPGEYPGYLLITYKAGWAVWPLDLEEVIQKMAAIDLMQTAVSSMAEGITSRNADGWAESYGEGHKLINMYEKQCQEILSRHKQYLVG